MSIQMLQSTCNSFSLPRLQGTQKVERNNVTNVSLIPLIKTSMYMYNVCVQQNSVKNKIVNPRKLPTIQYIFIHLAIQL